MVTTTLIPASGVSACGKPPKTLQAKTPSSCSRHFAPSSASFDMPVRGGSTISQQTAKNVFLWQGSGWTRYVRKGFEAWFTLLIENIWGKRRIMEVYLNVAETGLGTYGVEAGAQRYFKHSSAQLGPVEAARIAAALPAPKRREVVAPGGFTRRHGNTIAKRRGVVRNGGLDACVYD